ncbi:ankyrin repeat-containing protein [Aspergillus flavus]|nr:ankyrin repeat-containing protein [Aspergillus flavus]
MANPDLGCDGPFKHPLSYAVENNYKDIVQILLSTEKADPIPGLQAAISMKQIATIRSFLGIAGVDPNTQDRVSGQTALMAAIQAQDLQFVQALLENKMVDINAQNWAGGTALMLAVWFKDLDAVELLVGHGRSQSKFTKLGWCYSSRFV